MTTRGEFLDRIRRYFSIFASDIKQKSAVNRQDDNITGENIAAGLLNLICGYHLRNANQVSRNHKAIDLLDPDAEDGGGVAVQITSSNTRQKVMRTMRGFQDGAPGQRLCDEYAKLIVLILTVDDKFKGWDGIFHEDYSVSILNLMDLSTMIEDFEPERLGRILDYLVKELGVLPDGAVQRPTHLLPDVPHATHSFVPGSRDRELAKLIPAAASGEPVYIWGLGGMGKTQAAIQLARRMNPPRGAYFLHYTLPMGGRGEAMRETILQAGFSGYRFQGTDNENRDAEYRERMDILRNEYADALLIIDNFDWPGKTLTDLQSEASFADLTRAGLKLVFTTRYAVEVPEWKIGPISDEALLTLMRQSCTDNSVTDEDLLTLIRAVDGHTLMVDLMAKTMRRSRGRVTPRTLLQALGDSNLDQEDFPDVASDRNTEHSQRQIYAHLKALFDLSAMGKDERAVLRCATLLPEDGMDYNLFREALEKEQRKLLDRLVDDSWLQCPEKLLLIHPLVREVCRKELVPTDDNCDDFLTKLWQQNDFKREYDAVKYAQLAKCFSLASERWDDHEGRWAGYAGTLWGLLGQYGTALEYELQMVSQREKNCLSDSEYLALAYNDTGITYGKLGDYQKELKYHLKTLEIYEKVLPPDHRDLAASYNNVGSAYGFLGKNQEALEYVLKAFVIWEKVLPPDHPDLAASYNNVGSTYGALGDRRKALDYKLKALGIWEMALPPDHPSLAVSYDNVGSTYGTLGEHGKALEYVLKALAIREKVLLPDHPDLAKSYNNVGNTYGDLGDHGKALEYKLKALVIQEKVLPTEHPDLAKSYSSVGVNYFTLGDYRKALEYNQKALEIRKKVLPSDHSDIALSYENMGTTCNNLGDYRKALEYNQKALEIREMVLSPDDLDLAYSYENMGTTYDGLGDHQKALEYKLKAMGIRENVLPRDHRDLATSYNNMGFCYGNLGDHRQALEYQLKAVAIWEKVLPNNHPDLAISYNNVGCAYANLEDYQNALKQQIKALEVQEKVLPPDHPHLAISYNNLGATYYYLGEYERSLELSEKALAIREKKLLAGHQHIKATKNNMNAAKERLAEQEAVTP